jgi:integrase
VENWLSRLAPTSRRASRGDLNLFMKWLQSEGGSFKDFTPDDLVKHQLEAGNGQRFDVVNLFERHILSMVGRRSTKKVRLAHLRSFMVHNRADVPSSRFTIQADRPKVQGDLSPDEIRQIILSSNPMFAAIFISAFQAGMGAGQIIYWSNNGLEKLRKDLQGNPDVIRIDFPMGRKRNEEPYYSFLGPDSITKLRKWLEIRPDKGDSIFITKRGNPLGYFALSAYWNSHLRKTGIQTRKKGGPKGERSSVRTAKNLHEMRDTRKSLWMKSDAKPVVCEFTMGHQTDALGYDKSWKDVKFYEDEFRKALPFLQILTGTKAYKLVAEDEVEGLRAEVQTLRHRLQTVEEKRGQADDVMNRLVEDPEFLATMKKALDRLKG